VLWLPMNFKSMRDTIEYLGCINKNKQGKTKRAVTQYKWVRPFVYAPYPALLY